MPPKRKTKPKKKCEIKAIDRDLDGSLEFKDNGIYFEGLNDMFILTPTRTTHLLV